jgi:hypothetical protein
MSQVYFDYFAAPSQNKSLSITAKLTEFYISWQQFFNCNKYNTVCHMVANIITKQL